MQGMTTREKLCTCYKDIVDAMVDAQTAWQAEEDREGNRLGCLECYATTMSKLAETLEAIRVALTEFV